MKKYIVIVLLLLCSSPAYSFRPFILHSGKNKVKVIEFYTSEACEKCEAPEKWLGNLRSDKGLFKKFIVVSRKKDSGDLPSFVVDGEEMPWDENKLPDLSSEKPEEVGDLSVARNRLKEFEITFSPKAKLDKVDINVALLGSGVSNFVVLEFVTKSLRKSGNIFSGHVKLEMAKNPDVKTYSTVFWTTEGDSLKPIQAVGGDIKLE